jgi:hypothetical protein
VSTIETMRPHLLLLFALASCGSSAPAIDSRTPDTTTIDRAAPAEARSDLPIPLDKAKPDGGTVFGQLTDPDRWTSFNLPSVNAAAHGYMGVGFDGRYLYFVPVYPTSVVARYDTTADFGQAGAWTFFDVTTIKAQAASFTGAAFDGRYLYLAPSGLNPTALAARYDTTLPFAAPSSWSLFPITSLNVAARGFAGAVFDKRYVYFVPFLDGSNYSGVLARLDTTSDFTAAASWTIFDLTTVDPLCRGYLGGVFDGRYLYLVPQNTPFIALRYDTTAPLASTTSWSKFTLPGAKGYGGGAFDGRYLYLVPHDGPVARHDTTASFSSPGSWSFFDLASVDAKARGYIGAAFDGRYLYLTPNGVSGVQQGRIARLDTSSSFDSASSWAIFDLGSLSPAAVGFGGAAFDGRYLYLAPCNEGASGMVLRFDDKTPPSRPSCYNGSFF